MKLPWQKSESAGTSAGSTTVELGGPAAPATKRGGSTRLGAAGPGAADAAQASNEGAGGRKPDNEGLVTTRGKAGTRAPARRKGYTPPKGRPTPKRQEQEIKRGVIRDPDALTPTQRRQRDKELKQSMSKEEWKEHKRAQRAEARRSNQEIQARIDAGDDRYVLDRDKGEVRRFVRDWIDSRRFLNNYVMFAALVMLLIMFLGSFIPQLATVLSLLSMVFIVAVLAEAVIIGQRANRAVRDRFPDTNDTGFGLGMYAFSRASQPRRWRSPKPRVAVGDKV